MTRTEREYIGQASMEKNGTIILTLRAEDESGDHGNAQLFYPKEHPAYAEILEHIGELKPGEEKLVRPWPDQ